MKKNPKNKAIKMSKSIGIISASFLLLWKWPQFVLVGCVCFVVVYWFSDSVSLTESNRLYPSSLEKDAKASSLVICI